MLHFFPAARVAAVAGRHRAHLAHAHHLQLGRQLPHLRPQMKRKCSCAVVNVDGVVNICEVYVQ